MENKSDLKKSEIKRTNSSSFSFLHKKKKKKSQEKEPEIIPIKIENVLIDVKNNFHKKPESSIERKKIHPYELEPDLKFPSIVIRVGKETESKIISDIQLFILYMLGEKISWLLDLTLNFVFEKTDIKPTGNIYLDYNNRFDLKDLYDKKIYLVFECLINYLLEEQELLDKLLTVDKFSIGNKYYDKTRRIRIEHDEIKIRFIHDLNSTNYMDQYSILKLIKNPIIVNFRNCPISLCKDCLLDIYSKNSKKDPDSINKVFSHIDCSLYEGLSKPNMILYSKIDNLNTLFGAFIYQTSNIKKFSKLTLGKHEINI